MEVPLGTVVRARVAGWTSSRAECNSDNDPDPPELDGVPEFVQGELGGWQVDVPEQNIRYFKYRVAGHDVEPESIEVVDSR